LGEEKKQIIGVILLNLGGPDSVGAVKPFLLNLFADRNIIQLGPPFLQKPIAHLISNLRSRNTEKMYSLIGGKSPILEITIAQAEALEETLNTPPPTPPPREGRVREGVTGVKFKVYVGMRYWHPFIENVVPDIYRSGIKKIIALSLYPQYSISTTGSSVTKFKEVIKKYPMEVSFVPSWFKHPLYIEALVDVIKKGLESFEIKSETRNSKSEIDVHVLFSAHSLPHRIIEQGDPYVQQIMGTIEEITRRFPLKWHLSYQSRSGPVKWLEPSTEGKIEEIAKSGVENLLIVPISFVSDHVETLYEIDILYKNIAGKLGMRLKRTDSLNTHPVFIKALKNIVIKHTSETGWL
jgi:ferrochelatase